MKSQLRFVGVGGQGVILAGEILSAAKIKAGGYGVKVVQRRSISYLMRKKFYILMQTRAR